MAGFGGSVKLTGESEYRKALAQITQSLKVVSAEMKATSTSFATGDKSTKDLANASQQLSTALDKQKASLSTLKSQLATMSAEYSKTGAKHQELVDKYNAEKSKLDEIGRTLGTSSNEYKNQQKVVTELSQEVDKSSKAYDAQGKALNDMRIKTANAETTANQTAKALDDLGKEAEESGEKAEKGSDGFTVMKGVLANLATQAINNAINGLKNLGKAFVDTGKQALASYGEFEQLQGGAQKIFDEMDYSQIEKDASEAYKSMGISASQYLDQINSVGATFSATMGDKKGYETAKQGMQAIADFASGTGKSVDVLNEKYQLITKSASSYQSIADQFAGVLPQTSADFLKQAQATGALSSEYKKLTDVPVAEYQQAVTKMMQDGVKNLGLTNNAVNEATSTMTGSLASMKASWKNLLTGLADENANFGKLASDFVGTLVTEDGKGGVLGTIIPRISTVITGISSAIQTLLPQLIQTVVPLIQQNIPIIMEAVNGALQTVLSVLPQIIPVIADLIPQIVNTLVGLLPEIINAGIQLLMGLIQGITDAIPQLTGMLPDVIDSIITTLTDNLPQIIEMGLNLLVALTDGIIKAIPKLVAKLPKIITNIVNTLLGMLPKIVDTGVKLLVSLVQNMPTIINGIVKALPKLITGLINGLLTHLPEIISAGVKLLVALVQNIPAIISGVVKAVPQIIKALVKGIVDSVPQLAKAGLNLIKGLWEGIGNAKDWIMGKISGFMDGIVGGIKKFFGIHSPSTLMRDQIGDNLAKGIGVGFEDEMKTVSKQMQDSIPTNFDVNTSINGSRYSNSSVFSQIDMVDAFKDAMSQMKIELDDEVAGKFVEKTVAKAIYA